ncbi:MAG TPA: response regulator [Desulfotignum sp.]|nr:response regulator [Desulfotignum sp.]
MNQITGTLLIPVIIIVLAVTPCSARDFMVEFIAEHYKETQIPYSKTPQIYHSIQVNTHAGPKLLILKGDDLTYRTWLRQYIAENNRFIARVADAENDRFVGSRAYEMDVTQLHPVTNKDNWEAPFPADAPAEQTLPIMGFRHILVIDTNETRTRLIADVIKAMGYTPVISRNGNQALEMFRIQPEKFKMIIANHKAPGIETEAFVAQVLKIGYPVPILVETGYRDPKTRQHYQNRFSSAGSVVLTPMVLNNLQKNIQGMINNVSTEQPPSGDTPEAAS